LTARDQLTVVSEVIRRVTGSQAFVDERSQFERDALSHLQPVKRLEDRRLGVMCSARRVPVAMPPRAEPTAIAVVVHLQCHKTANYNITHRQQLCCVQSSALLIKHLNDIIDINRF